LPLLIEISIRGASIRIIANTDTKAIAVGCRRRRRWREWHGGRLHWRKLHREAGRLSEQRWVGRGVAE